MTVRAYVVVDPGDAGGCHPLGVVEATENGWIGAPYGKSPARTFETVEEAEKYVRGVRGQP
ncbi:hypothetical protein ACDY99_30050 [Achromobacter dolens]|uniref:hypothetical protein n=1 Tax=Achromobacter dolens TaxID=1287738 RepID=UPI00355697D2